MMEIIRPTRHIDIRTFKGYVHHGYDIPEKVKVITGQVTSFRPGKEKSQLAIWKKVRSHRKIKYIKQSLSDFIKSQSNKVPIILNVSVPEGRISDLKKLGELNEVLINTSGHPSVGVDSNSGYAVLKSKDKEGWKKIKTEIQKKEIKSRWKVSRARTREKKLVAAFTGGKIQISGDIGKFLVTYKPILSGIVGIAGGVIVGKGLWWVGKTLVEQSARAVDYIKASAEHMRNIEMGGYLSAGYMSAEAATERQAGVKALMASPFNGREMLGQEAQMYS